MSAIGPVDCAFVLVMLGTPVAIITLSPPMAWQDWALLIIVMTGLTAVGQPVRAIVRHNAPLYGEKNIVIVGAGYGFLLAAGIFLISRFRLLWDPMPIAAISLLSWWGFQATGYIGFQPDQSLMPAFKDLPTTGHAAGHQRNAQKPNGRHGLRWPRGCIE